MCESYESFFCLNYLHICVVSAATDRSPHDQTPIRLCLVCPGVHQDEGIPDTPAVPSPVASSTTPPIPREVPAVS